MPTVQAMKMTRCRKHEIDYLDVLEENVQICI